MNVTTILLLFMVCIVQIGLCFSGAPSHDPNGPCVFQHGSLWPSEVCYTSHWSHCKGKVEAKKKKKITCCECGPWILWKLARCYWAWCYKELCKSLNSLKLWTRKVHQLPWRKTYSRSCDMASVSCIHDIQHQCLPFLQKWFIRNKQVACPPPSAWIIVITSIYQAFAKVPGTIYRCCGKSFFDMQFKTNLG